MSDIPSVITPMPCLNGTSTHALMEQRVNASEAVRGVLESLAAMAPNARDYQLAPERFPQAVAQHQRRMAQTEGLLDEITQELDALGGV